jgi:hypothetical protein
MERARKWIYRDLLEVIYPFICNTLTKELTGVRLAQLRKSKGLLHIMLILAKVAESEFVNEYEQLNVQKYFIEQFSEDDVCFTTLRQMDVDFKNNNIRSFLKSVNESTLRDLECPHVITEMAFLAALAGVIGPLYNLVVSKDPNCYKTIKHFGRDTCFKPSKRNPQKHIWRLYIATRQAFPKLNADALIACYTDHEMLVSD